MDPERKFWFHRLQEGTILREHGAWLDGTVVPTKNLYAQYVDFARNMGKPFVGCTESLTKKLKRVCRSMSSGKANNVRGIRCGTLDQCREDFAREVGMPIKWESEE